MIISPSLVKDYPQLAVWICDNLPKVRDKAKIFKAFQKYSRMNEKVAERAIKHKSPPTIEWRYMPTANGEYDAKYPDSVFISVEICKRFSSASQDERTGMATLIESTLLHEMVHWGDHQDGKTDDYAEMGKAFEIEAYGQDIRAPWSKVP